MYRKYSNKKRNDYEDSIFIIIGFLALIIYSKTKKVEFTIYCIAALFIVTFAIIVLFRGLNKIKIKNRYLNSGLNVVDKMSGEEFETFLKAHYEKHGFKVDKTPKSNDYGADLILKKDSLKIVLQAKRWNSRVGIEAIQQIVAAINYYNADKGIVVTNNYFTKNAYELALKNNIELYDRNKLIKIMISSKDKNIINNTSSNEKLNSYDDNICPVCGGKLVIRTGRNGKFLGCSNFPKCRYTKNI